MTIPSRTKPLIFLLFIAFLCACNSTGLIGDPYKQTVNCDSNLPMSELLKCVDDKYAFMDSIHKDPHIESDKQYRSWDKRDYSPLPTDYRKTDNFKSIKPCYEKDKCQFYSKYDGRGLVTYDEYGDRKMRIENRFLNIMGEAYFDGTKNMKISKSLRQRAWKTAFGGGGTRFIRSYKISYKDIVISSDNQQPILYVPLVELSQLRKNKTLVTANINRFCLGEQPEWWKGKVIDTIFKPCGIYRFSYVSKQITKNIPILISLDKRVNPSKIYIKINNDAFEVDINNQGESK